MINIYKRFDNDLKGPISFLNLASIDNTIGKEKYSEIRYYCDGMLLSGLLSLLTLQKVNRFSFDFTSIADRVFADGEKYRKKFYFIGATEKEIQIFTDKIRDRYKNILIDGYVDGYFTSYSRQKTIDAIVSKKTDIVIVSLGADHQDDFLIDLYKAGYSGTAITSGGFIRQSSHGRKIEYYPQIIKKLRLRGFYRMYKEPHTIKRYILDYPSNAIKIISLISRKKIKIH